MGAHELSALLWRERELLDVLQFTLEVEQLLLTTGNTRWLNRASTETPTVSDLTEPAAPTSSALTTMLWPAREPLRAQGVPRGIHHIIHLREQAPSRDRD